MLCCIRVLYYYIIINISNNNHTNLDFYDYYSLGLMPQKKIFLFSYAFCFCDKYHNHKQFQEGRVFITDYTSESQVLVGFQAEAGAEAIVESCLLVYALLDNHPIFLYSLGPPAEWEYRSVDLALSHPQYDNLQQSLPEANQIWELSQLSFPFVGWLMLYFFDSKPYQHNCFTIFSEMCLAYRKMIYQIIFQMSSYLKITSLFIFFHPMVVLIFLSHC